MKRARNKKAKEKAAKEKEAKDNEAREKEAKKNKSLNRVPAPKSPAPKAPAPKATTPIAPPTPPPTYVLAPPLTPRSSAYSDASQYSGNSLPDEALPQLLASPSPSPSPSRTSWATAEALAREALLEEKIQLLIETSQMLASRKNRYLMSSIAFMIKHEPDMEWHNTKREVIEEVKAHFKKQESSCVIS